MTDTEQGTLPGAATDQTLDLDTLESHLWEAAEILRGSIDSADYKNYIFGLLFLKRINDRFEEETEELAREHGIPEEMVENDRDLHKEFWVPKRARWNHITAQESDIGAALNKALEAVEDENDEIADRVLSSIDYNDKDRLGNQVLDKLVTHFSIHRYRNTDLDDPDIFGRAYEYLIRQFADDAGKKGGEFYTPREVVELIVECVDPEPGDRVYDPCCGSGGMLIYSAQHVADNGGSMADLSLYGQERNLNTWAIGQMNMLLHEVKDANIQKDDTITSPQFVTGHDELEQFDRVIANPMWNQGEWSKEWVQDNEPYNRFPYGLPPSNNADWAWIQLMLASLNKNGKMGIVMDQGVLFRSRSEKSIRQPIIEDDLVEAVISLPKNLFYNTSSPGCILILNKDKPAEKQGKVQFIYAEDMKLRDSGVQTYREGSDQNHLTTEAVNHISNVFKNSLTEPHHSRVVELQEIRENDWNLSVPRYVDITEPEQPIDVNDKLDQIRELERELDKITGTLDEYVRDKLLGQNSDNRQSESYNEVQLGPKTVYLPKEWELKQVSEMFEIQKESYTPSDNDEKVFLYSMPAFDEGQKPKETVSTDVGSKKYIVPNDTILFPKLNIRKRRFWRVTHNHQNKAICSTEFWPLVPKIDLCLDFYNLYFDSSEFMRNPKVSTSSSTNSHQRVKEGSFKNVKLPVPPLAEQKRIAEILTTTEDRIRQTEQLAGTLTELKRGLMQDILTGKVRTPEDLVD